MPGLSHCLSSPRDKVLWAALTMGSYGLFCSRELAQPKLAEAGTPHFISVQDVAPHFSVGQLQYVWVFLASSKTDHFHQGCPVIGCTRTICGACEAWHLLQQHQCTGSSLEAPFFKINDRALDTVTLVNHIKHLATSLGLDSSRYSGHSLRIGGATSDAQAGLSQWQIKTVRAMEQPGVPDIHQARSPGMCRLGCPHGSKFISICKGIQMPRERRSKQLIGGLGHLSATCGSNFLGHSGIAWSFHLSALAQALQRLPLKVSCLT